MLLTIFLKKWEFVLKSFNFEYCNHYSNNYYFLIKLNIYIYNFKKLNMLIININCYKNRDILENRY